MPVVSGGEWSGVGKTRVSFKNALEEAALRLQSVEIPESRKALLIPVSLVVAWEAYVCDESVRS